MNYIIGDFITSNFSFYPSLIVNIKENSSNITIHEYCGKTKWINNNYIIGKIDLKIEDKLCLLTNYNSEYSKLYTNLINEMIIELVFNIHHY